MGEAAAKLRLIFEHIKKIRGVYFFDEFDAIGSSRGATNDVGEIRRILNSFLQFIENLRSDSLILAATNHEELLDKALFRRFDDILHYELPDNKLVIETFKRYLSKKYIKDLSWTKIEKEAVNLSYAEIAKICNNALKRNILDNTPVDTRLIITLIQETKTHKG